MAERPQLNGSLLLDVEWLDGSGVRSPELAATWCRLEVEVEGRPVTLVEDQRTRATRKGLYCSAYSLAEWVATSWWPLRSHVRPLSDGGTSRHPSEDSWRWHDMRAASDGFAWPRLSIHPAGDATELVWTADREPRGVIQYLTSGRVWLDAAEVQQALGRFVELVIDRLDGSGLKETLLHEEWSAITASDEEEASFCDAAAALGLDPYDIGDCQAAAIEQTEGTVGAEMARDLAAVSEPDHLLEDLRWTTRSLTSLGSIGSPNGRLLEFSSVIQGDNPAGGDVPWRLGYQRAGVLRRVLAVAEPQPVDLAAIVRLGRAVPGRNPALLGVAGAASEWVRVIPSTGYSGWAARFLQARSLHSALRQPSRPSLVSAIRTWDAQVERAFAAELLAPAKGLATQLADGGPFVSMAEVQRLAKHFRAPPAVIEHQLENQLQLTVAE